MGDKDGELTYISARGDSVIDYCCISDKVLPFFKGFHVDEQIFSDHFPIVLKLQSDSPKIDNTLPLLPKLIGLYKTLKTTKYLWS